MNLDKCIICDKSDDLNTSMDLSIDDKKHTIHLCDEHADDTTPKQAREALKKRVSQLEDIIKQAEALGLTIVHPSESKKVIVVDNPEAEAAAPAVAKTLQKLPEFKGASGSASGEGGSVGVASHSAIPIDSVMNNTISEMKESGKLASDVRPETYERELQQLTTKSGRQVILPSKIVGNTGTTVVKVVDSGGDRALQDRFKSEAQNSVGMEQGTLSAQPSYENDTVMCTFCGGTGVSRMGNVACPKCNGAGLLISE